MASVSDAHHAQGSARGHFQTILGHFLRVTPPLRGGTDEVIALEDGDELFARAWENNSACAIVVFHGLGGNISASYMQRTAKICVEQGHSVLLVNHRGCGKGRDLIHRKPYHSGSQDDAAAALRFARRRFRRCSKFLAIGFSLSGNVVLLLAGSGRHAGTEGLPDAVIAVNPPIRLDSAARYLDMGLNQLYDWRFRKQCFSEIRRRSKKGWITATPAMFRARNLRELDDHYTAPHAGFGTKENYYALCSSAPVLSKIEIPTRILSAKDDPFVDYREYLKAQLSPSVRLQLIESGGHMGYLAWNRGLRFVMDETLASWLAELAAS